VETDRDPDEPLPLWASLALVVLGALALWTAVWMVVWLAVALLSGG
jgi:hypothetical protein